MYFKRPSFSRRKEKKVLLPELVPSTAWCNNLRSELPAARWDVIRRFVYQRAGYRCEVCGGKGEKHPVECHEVWEYQKKIQRLAGLVALCPACHECKHIGLAEINGRMEAVVEHMVKVNGQSRAEVLDVIDEAFETWRERSEVDWKLDLKYLETLEC